MLDELTRRLWHRNARQGNPPPLREYCEIALGLQTPWHWVDHFFPIIDCIHKGGARQRFAREVSRDHGKSWLTYAQVLYAAEFVLPYLGVNPINQRIYLIGRDVPHALNEIMENLHEFIAEHAPHLKLHDWEEIYEAEGAAGIKACKPKNFNKSQFDLTNGVSIRGRSIEQGIRGAHVYLIVLDDIVDETNYMFAEKQHNVIQGALLPALKQGGVILVEGTPQADDDLYDRLFNDPAWDALRLPALNAAYREKNVDAIKRGLLPASAITRDADYECLWPWQHNMDSLDDARGQTHESNLKFEREWLLRRTTSLDAFVPSEHVLASLNPDLHYIHAAEPGEGPYYGGIDPSSLSVDDAAIAVGLVKPDGTLVPRNFTMLRAKHHKNSEASDPERKVVDSLVATSRAFNYPSMKLEKNGYQGVIRPFADLIDPHVASTLSKEHLGVNKHTESGWLALRTLFRSRRIQLPYGPTPQERAQIEAGLLEESQIEARRVTDELRQQIANLRVVEGRIINASEHIHDDMVSALFLLAKAARNAITSNISASAAPLPSGASLLAAANSQQGRNPELDGPQRDATMNRLQRAQRMAAGRRQY